MENYENHGKTMEHVDEKGRTYGCIWGLNGFDGFLWWDKDGKPMENQWETHGKPWKTHGKPMGNHGGTGETCGVSMAFDEMNIISIPLC